MICRHSSRRQPLARVLSDAIDGATGYDRIAGYFSSSILEVAGEPLDRLAPGAIARVLCNSDLQPLDVLTARAAQNAQAREWKAALPEDISPPLRGRLERLAELLTSGRLKVRVLPDERFGLIHGKAGVIERTGKPPLAFLGSVNESRTAWELNYELLWTDESAEAVAWVREEFEALWSDHQAVDLAEAVIQDVKRLTRRQVVAELPEWREEPESAASAAIELPVYRRENGLWAHQKWFVHHAFEAHKARGARTVLADQVGLGKTVQLALAAKLMLLWGSGNVLVLAPKPLLEQWREEIWSLLRLPSAVWVNNGWEDEREVFHPAPDGVDGLRKCPRRLGIVSTGLIKRSSEARELLASLPWECVILDEAHHARRSNRGPAHRNEAASPNNLLKFLWAVAGQTRSLLLATATPVQMDPIEAYDLLDTLNRRDGTVLGTTFSPWLTRARAGLDLVAGRADPPAELEDRWQWMRDPFPPASEGRDFGVLRKALGEPASAEMYRPDDFAKLDAPNRRRLQNVSEEFFAKHNPYIRHIVRRTREFLEEAIDPATSEPYLPKVAVRLFGEAPESSVYLPGELADAYHAAEEFCAEVGKRKEFNTGFLRTMLLRRVGSSIIAGQKTATKMLGPKRDELGDEAGVDEADDAPESKLYPLQPGEQEKLLRFLTRLERAPDDPKYREVERLLLEGAEGTGPWLELGCIVFSQYFDSVDWLAARLSERLPDETVAVYAGSGKSCLYRAGGFTRVDRDAIKRAVRTGEIRLVIGTDSASEGLNLQRLGTLINLDLPWNPTRLEQRKGRIQRIGQLRPEVFISNLRYRGSVEDRVHELLSSRLQAIRDLFGQLPDTLEDAWVAVAEQDEAKARQVIDAVPETHPFELRYDRIESVDWENCGRVLDAQTQLNALMRPWVPDRL
jgi:superfamily II DNA or RNA helicase